MLSRTAERASWWAFTGFSLKTPRRIPFLAHRALSASLSCCLCCIFLSISFFFFSAPLSSLSSLSSLPPTILRRLVLRGAVLDHTCDARSLGATSDRCQLRCFDSTTYGSHIQLPFHIQARYCTTIRCPPSCLLCLCVAAGHSTTEQMTSPREIDEFLILCNLPRIQFVLFLGCC